MDNNADIEVNIAYNTLPSSMIYEEKNFKTNFYVYGPKDKDREIKFVGIMIINHQDLNSRFGCAFSYIKNSNKDFDVNNPNYLKNSVFDRVKNKGIDYDRLSYFEDNKRLSVKKDKKKKRKSKDGEEVDKEEERRQAIFYEILEKRRKNNDKILRNKRSVANPDYIKKKNDDFYKRYNSEMRKIRKVKNNRDKILKDKIEEIRSRKTRNEVCKEKREIMILNLMEIFVRKSTQTAFIRILKVIGVFFMIRRRFRELKRRKKAVKILMIIGSLTANFIVPIRRFKKSSEIGCLERSKL